MKLTEFVNRFFPEDEKLQASNNIYSYYHSANPKKYTYKQLHTLPNNSTFYYDVYICIFLSSFENLISYYEKKDKFSF